MRTLEEIEEYAAAAGAMLTLEQRRELVREAHALGRSEGYEEGVEALREHLTEYRLPAGASLDFAAGVRHHTDHVCSLRALRDPSPAAGEVGARDTAPAEAATRPTPDAAPGAPEGGNYCTRCHMTEALHHVPNIYTGRKDARGNAYPPPCDEFTPAPSPAEDAPRCEECGGSGHMSPPAHPWPCLACGGTGRSTTGGGR